MKRLVIHIGPPKCASSTLQGYLTQNPILPLDDGTGSLRYVAIEPTGEIIHGEKAMRINVKRNRLGYLFSTEQTLTDPLFFDHVMAQIKLISASNDTVVLSCEGWGKLDFMTPEVGEVVNRAPVSVDIFLLTRPPVEWVPSAWWQGAAWEEEINEKNVTALSEKVNFYKLIAQWKNLKRVKRIGVHDISQGPVERFLEFTAASNAAPKPTKRLNVATDYDLIRHMIQNREHYGRTGKNPSVEFVLAELISTNRRELPKVMSRSLADHMIQRDFADNSALIEMIQENSAQPLAPDVVRRYLDPKAHENLPETIDFKNEFFSDYSDSFVRKIIDTILSLKKRNDETENISISLENFDPDRYLKLNPDVAEAGFNPFEHFIRHGFRENRRVI